MCLSLALSLLDHREYGAEENWPRTKGPRVTSGSEVSVVFQSKGKCFNILVTGRVLILLAHGSVSLK
jgi:hypothetical protein